MYTFYWNKLGYTTPHWSKTNILKGVIFKNTQIKKKQGENKDIYKEDRHAAAEQRRNVKPIDSVTMEGFGFTECALFTL